MKRHFMQFFAAAALLVASAAASTGLRAADCAGLASLKLADLTVSVAKSVPAGAFTPPSGQPVANLPAFCEVHGILKPTPASQIHFEVWLPAAGWNNELEGIGNGGLAGTIGYAQMGGALRQGYATVSTDTGHDSKESPTWLEDRERLIDYSYRGLHLATVAAKSIADAFYGQNVSHSYFVGCSTGGKQALMEAQRFPADYDGIVAGDAANFWTHQMANEVWVGVATSSPDTNLSREKLQLLQDAVLGVCDKLDGLQDGLVSDPERCHFDPKTLLCKGADGPTCLTAAQVGAVAKLYRGIVDPRSGKKLYPGFYPGGELGWGKDGGQMVINRDNSSGVSSYDFFRYALFANPGWDFRSFNFDSDLKDADEKLGPVTNSVNPNLDEFRKLGHKLLYYHGAADPLIPAANGVNYYETVIAAEGGGAKGTEQTTGFFRVFLVPGLYHCAGGPGPTAFGGNGAGTVHDADHDVLAAVSAWVEKGSAPEKIIATRFVDNTPSKGVAFQRPLCVYPAVAQYQGSGDPKDASSFRCERPK